jgi:hypothetical protein
LLDAGSGNGATAEKDNYTGEPRQIHRQLHPGYDGRNIGKTIGEGTFGKVKLGIHTLSGEKVAIKILEKNRIIDVADV